MSRRFTIVVACDNETFATNPGLEIEKLLALLRLSVNLYLGDPDKPATCSIADSNGNTVGRWSYDPNVKQE